jgi:carbonic anhydrase
LLPEDSVKKVFHFDSPREHYQSDAAVVWCFDQRFDLASQKFLKRNGVTITDVIKIAGGAKSLASPEQETDREFVLDQLLKSIKLHDTKRVILMMHSDCGAYGGLAAFRGDAAAEAAHHESELQRASSILRAAFPNLKIDAYFVDFEGVWDAGNHANAGQTNSDNTDGLKEPVA